MTDFHVRPPALRDFAAVLDQLEGAMTPALDYTRTWVDLAPSAAAGTLYADIRQRVQQARTTLIGVYQPGGEVTSYYRDAARAMRDVADDYEAVDAATREQFDELLALCGSPDYVDDTTVIAHRGETAGADAADLASTLAAPTDLLVDTMTGWQTFADVVGVVVSLEWVLWIFTGGPIAGPTADLARQLDDVKGDWGEVHEVALALGALSDFHFRVSGEIGAGYNRLHGDWQGLAANAAYANLDRFAEQLDRHAEALRNVEQQMNNQAWMAVLWADLALEALQAIVDLVSIDLTSIDSTLTNLLRKISTWVTLGRLAIDMVIGAVHGLGALLEGLENADLDFPAINPPPTDIGGTP
ncbi:hypothetical protein SAMN04489844_2507 [Nocardioides exalbidus]|uniref:Uncharacterized protein n=1 Tax=Nocardioides exalbidus TaxID=402596 RepID=A0A1H4TF89_9ACTN|nr:hypothetical protein [Nocardioides exalbidus]SEC55126.1 hypothetical protein SAMN04489844_2507 [Nocardioides exalbidus]